MPIGDLTNIGNTLRTLGAAGKGTRDAGLAGLRVAEERKILEGDRRVAQETEARKLVDGTLKSILAKSMGSVKDDVTLGQRRQKRDSIVVLMKQMKIPNEVIAQTVSEISRTPLAQSVEDKAKIALDVAVDAESRRKTADYDKKLFDGATFASQQAFMEHLNLTGKVDNSLLVVKPKTESKRNFVKHDDNTYEVGPPTAENPNGLRLVLEGKEKPPSATERKYEELNQAEEDLVKALDALGDKPRDLTLKLKAAIVKARTNSDRVEGRVHKKELMNAATALSRFDVLGGNVLNIIATSATTASGTIAGEGAKAVRGFSDTLSGLVALLPGEQAEFFGNKSRYSEQLETLAQGNDELQSLYYGIAYLNIMANGLTGQRVTNEGFKRAIADASSSTSPKAIANKMLSIRKRLVARLEANANFVLGGEYLQTNREFPAGRTIGEQPQPSNLDAYEAALQQRVDEKNASQ